jgi:hypothetical protein
MKASTDYENFYGRKSYATNTFGGYYATRLPILEFLERRKRQASVLAIRLETPSYWAALGVWVVRESVRKALSKKILDFRSIEELEEFGYAVYPNPSSGLFTLIEVSGLPVAVFVYNSTGQLILAIDFVSQTNIDLSSFDQGVYYLQLMNGSKVSHDKLILSK